MSQSIETFGVLADGTVVERCTISGGGLTVSILTYGATVQDLRLEGIGHPLVLGAPRLEPYLGEMTYFGAIVGRYANRIRDGRFTIDDRTFQVPRNWRDRHSLHGGTVGTGQKVWTIEDHCENRLRLGLVLADGEMGFPGRMTLRATFSLEDPGTLAIRMTARTDAATPCSLAHHGYFNLDGAERITDHLLEVKAPAYLPVDDLLIPTGEIAPVEGTPFDFRQVRRLGADIIDHNFCLSDGVKPQRPVACLQSPVSQLSMTVETSEPGLQVYTGAYMPQGGIAGLDGRRYGPFAGIALETQSWPDAPNQAQFPNAILTPSETYDHRVSYIFSKGAVQ